ncbi:secretin receptor-like protein [Labeo rohita]|uniref:Secretin receptor-like protein n=1 Tax=Labeo rohita TaxID=84645 RepID=A0A498LG07_LABRO|nr:secretin receptor-like protein [Labeo rohita]
MKVAAVLHLVALAALLHSCSHVLVSHEYFFYVKIMYSAGYAISLVSLSIALTVLCVFRAIFIFVRDAALRYSQEYYHCNSHPPGCKVALFLSNYCILANYSWLLVEGHYLHSLINLSLRSQKKRVHWYILLGWDAGRREIMAGYGGYCEYQSSFLSQSQKSRIDSSTEHMEICCKELAVLTLGLNYKGQHCSYDKNNQSLYFALRHIL